MKKKLHAILETVPCVERLSDCKVPSSKKFTCMQIQHLEFFSLTFRFYTRKICARAQEVDSGLFTTQSKGIKIMESLGI